MRFSNVKTDDETTLVDEDKTITSSSPPPHRDHHSSIQCNTLRNDHMSFSMDKSSPSADYIYTEIVKAIGNNEFGEEKRLLKRASWSPSVPQEHGLPPTGKRIDNEQSTTNRNPNRVRMRPKVARYYQPQQQQQKPVGRPVSFNERYDHLQADHQQRKLSNSSTVRYIIYLNFNKK
jgi:hypothetical protein